MVKLKSTAKPFGFEAIWMYNRLFSIYKRLKLYSAIF